MEIGTDEEGRSITYDQASQRFAIEGMVTGIDRLVAYDRSGHVRWVSDEFRDWVYEYDRVAREHANRPVSYSASKPVVAVPGAAERQVGPLKPSRQQVVAALVVAGLLGACMLSFLDPIPPLAEDRVFRADLEHSLQQAVGDDYTLEFRSSRFKRGPTSMIPVMPDWIKEHVVVARSDSNPEFAVSMLFMFGEGGDWDSRNGRVRRDILEAKTEWVRTLDGMPADRKASFKSWWAARPDQRNLEVLQLAEGARMSLPAGVDPASVYSISWTPVMASPVAVPMTSADSWTGAGWDSGRGEWVELGQP